MLALWLTLLTDVNIVKTLFCDPRPQSWKRQTQGSVWNSHSHHSFSRSNRQQDSPGPFKPQTLGLPQGLIIAGGCLGNLYIKRHLCFSGLSFPSFQECSFSTIGTDIKVLLLLLKVMLKKMTRAGRRGKPMMASLRLTASVMHPSPVHREGWTPWASSCGEQSMRNVSLADPKGRHVLQAASTSREWGTTGQR